MEIGLVKKIDIDAEMRESYLSYAMSVIVSRALPDARDGLKPVQRRILYAMHDMGLSPNQSYKKSARVVGEVLGKYHPHGDQSVYDAMVRMAQDFSMRYALVDGQGNFGSIDGDAAAAMRYTEARMARVGSNMLDDIQKETVDFALNFDDSLAEPTVLPAVIPNLLVNGSSGIAVGMSTSVPPHNLGEVADALGHLIENWERIDEVTSADLLQFIHGPDFPTGGVVFRYRENKKAEDGKVDALTNAYSTGKGRITVRAKVHLEEMERGKSRIVITELPYQTNKTNLISRIADLHRNGKVEGLTDLRDETDRNGIRIVLETTRNVDPEEILKTLYRLTPLQGTFSINIVALVNGEPRVLNLKQALRVYVEHRLEIIRRRSEYDLRKAEERAHILQGLLIALDNLDEVIATIRRSRTVETARNNLIKEFKLSDVQAQAILDMPLRRLAALERRKIQDEFKEKRKLIKELKSLLSSPKMMRDVIVDELSDVVESYADRRQTQIVDMLDSDVTIPRDLIPDEDTWVMLGEQGNVARSSSAESMKIAGKMSEMPLALFKASMQDLVYFFTADGQAVCLAAHQLPQSNEYGTGMVPVYELTPLSRNQMVVAAVVVPRANLTAGAGFITLATLGGSVKRIRVEDIPGVSSEAFTVIRVDDDDSLGWARLTTGNDQIMLATAMGYVIRFKEEAVRPMGLPAGGIGGVKLKGDIDGVISLDIAKEDGYLWSITDTGMAKATPLNEYPTQGRNGQGVVNLKLTSDVGGEIVTVVVGDLRTRLLVKSATNTVKGMPIKKAKVGGRAVKPTAVAKAGPRSRVVGVVRVYDASQDIFDEPEVPNGEQLALLG